MSADWTYADRYMKSYEGKGGLNNLEYTFDAGNLVDVSGTSFEYDQTQKYTRPGMDIAALFLQLSNIDYTQDWGWMYAAFTGLIGEKSAGIPVQLTTDRMSAINRMYFIFKIDLLFLKRVCQNANFRIFSGFSILIINKLQLYNLSKHAF